MVSGGVGVWMRVCWWVVVFFLVRVQVFVCVCVCV